MMNDKCASALSIQRSSFSIQPLALISRLQDVYFKCQSLMTLFALGDRIHPILSRQGDDFAADSVCQAA
ncbi:MAG TPA: hypothetical protein PKY10_15065 [Lentisphaeria bacterium]|nr:hypothetical protein [Lentisphaeria bacterium]